MDSSIAKDQPAWKALSSLGVGVVETDSTGRVVQMNAFAEKMTGWRIVDARHRPFESVFHLVDTLGGDRQEPAYGVDGSEDGGPKQQAALIIRRDGQRFPVEYALAPSGKDGDPERGVVAVFTDATERRLMTLHHERVRKQDLLTGLLNRKAFTENLTEAMDRGRSGDGQHVLCFLDIDQFKLVNDTCGHEAGDDLLEWVAAMLREAVGERDSVARFGGDEYAVLLVGRTLDDGIAFAEGLKKRLREFSFKWGDKSFAISAAMGVAPIQGDRMSPAQILSAADHACYSAKEKGRGSIQIFELDDEEAVDRLDEMNLVAQIHRKLQDGHALLYAQQIRRLKAGPSPGQQLEVLLRFKGDNGAVHDPGKIIAATERFGLMPTVDCWVIKNTLDHLRHMGAQALDRIDVCFINLSGLSLQDDSVLGFIRGELAKNGVPPQKIGFEITETTAARNLQQAQWFIQEVGSLGCRLSLDDFGTGVASYSYLKALPVDFLKIDGGFVESMLTSPLDRAMVESINQIAHVLGIETVAESVGSRELLAHVGDIGIDHAQGFFICHPQPLNEVCPLDD